MSYLSLTGRHVSEKIIEKSRFIATSEHVENEAEAKAFIEEVRKNYRDATHNCYAYIADELGNLLRFSDDGEPQGTAGMPMLEVLKNNNLRQVAVVVTRYFGGIKLGAGGLVRAYAGAVAENLEKAVRVEYEPCAEYFIAVDYALADTAHYFLAGASCTIEGTEYADRVAFKVAVKERDEQSFLSALTNRLGGKFELRLMRRYLFPFKI